MAARKKQSIVSAAQRRFKGKYAGPDKYKGVIPDHLKSKYKGTYFGKEKNEGRNVVVSGKKVSTSKPVTKLPTLINNKNKKPIPTKPSNARHPGKDPDKIYAL
jgi:hypothetical protein